MSQDYANYRQALGLNFGSITDKMQSLKDDIYNEKIAPFMNADTLNNLGLTEGIQQIANLKNTVQGFSGTLGGILQTAGTFMGLKNLQKTVSSKLGLKTDTADVEKGAETEGAEGVEGAEGAEGAEGKTPSFSDLFGGEGGESNFSGLFEGGDPITSLKSAVQNAGQELLNNVQANAQRAASALSDQARGVTNNLGITNESEPGVSYTETDLRPTTVDIPDSQGGVSVTKNPSGSGGGDVELSTFNDNSETEMTTYKTNVEPDEEEDTFTGTGDAAATDAAEAAAEAGAEAATDGIVAGLETAGGILDAIPVVGDIVGAILGIGGAIFGAVEGSNQNKLESEQTQNDMNLVNTQTALKQGIDKIQFQGASVIPTLSSTGSMPISSGTF